MVEVNFEEISRIEKAKVDLRDEIIRQSVELKSRRAYLAELEASEELRLGLRMISPLKRIRSTFQKVGGRG